MTRVQYIRMILVGVVLPAALGLAGLIGVIALTSQLPDPVAVHWGPSGGADGFGPAWVLAVIPLLAVLYALFALIVTRGARREGITWSQRGILAVGAFLSAVLATAGVGSAALQVGLTDATDAPSVLPVVALGILGGAVLTVGAWFALPRHVSLARPGTDATPSLDLAPTERAVWIRRVEPGRGAVALIIGGLALAITAGAVVVWASGPLLNLLVWLGILVLVVLAVASTMFWTVRVDASGLEVRSALGAPRFRYPIGELISAGVTTVNPTRDFAGWGIRTRGDGRTGIVVRAGEALEVQRTGGKVIVVTVDDAQPAAALLNAYIARSSEHIQ